jgi:DNA-directed RNA polymerase specialized sigma24 family protein
MNLPNKYKVPIYLYYYMDYDSAEIAQILHKPKSTIRYSLSEARKKMKQIIDL